MALIGDVFYQHRDLLRILAVSLVAGPIVHGGGSVAVALGHFREYLRVSGLYVMVAIALTVILVPTLGVEGAALAMTNLLGGHVMVASTASSGYAPHLKAKTLRLIAVMSE